MTPNSAAPHIDPTTDFTDHHGYSSNSSGDSGSNRITAGRKPENLSLIDHLCALAWIAGEGRSEKSVVSTAFSEMIKVA